MTTLTPLRMPSAKTLSRLKGSFYKLQISGSVPGSYYTSQTSMFSCLVSVLLRMLYEYWADIFLRRLHIVIIKSTILETTVANCPPRIITPKTAKKIKEKNHVLTSSLICLAITIYPSWPSLTTCSFLPKALFAGLAGTTCNPFPLTLLSKDVEKPKGFSSSVNNSITVPSHGTMYVPQGLPFPKKNH